MQEKTEKKGLRCAIYIRVSTSEQAMHGKSLSAQTEYLTRYAKEQHMEIIGIFADEGKTARKNFKDRKAIKKLLEHVKQNQVDIILFWKMDRWFRNVSDFYKVQDILDAHHTKWIAVAEPNMNLETREGRLNLNIMLSINQNETDTTSERIRFVNEASVQQGKVITGSQPFGYKIQNSHGIRQIVKDRQTEAIVQEFYRHYLIHHSKRGAFLHLTRTYGPVITMRQIDSLCSNSMYSGLYRGNPNYCPPYLTPEQWEDLQWIKKHNIKKYASQELSKEVYLFPGLISCPVCGRSLGCNRVTKKQHTKQMPDFTAIYRYYRCQNWVHKRTCSYSKLANEATIERFLLNCVDKELSGYYIHFQRIQVKSDTDTALEKWKPNQAKIQQELERLNWLFQKGRISKERYEMDFQILDKQLMKPDGKPDEVRNFDNSETFRSDNANQTIHTAQAVDTAQAILTGGWKCIYNHLSRENKQAFWRCLVKEIQLNEDNSFVKAIVFL